MISLSFSNHTKSCINDDDIHIYSGRKKKKANEMQTFKFMRVAKQLEISLSKIILGERQSEKIALEKVGNNNNKPN